MANIRHMTKERSYDSVSPLQEGASMHTGIPFAVPTRRVDDISIPPRMRKLHRNVVLALALTLGIVSLLERKFGDPSHEPLPVRAIKPANVDMAAESAGNVKELPADNEPTKAPPVRRATPAVSRPAA